jgi:hypothetical protein
MPIPRLKASSVEKALEQLLPKLDEIKAGGFGAGAAGRPSATQLRISQGVQEETLRAVLAAMER